MLENKKKAFEDTITTQKAQMQHQGQQEWLGTTAQEVSYKAVDLMIQQKRIALEALPSSGWPNPPALNICTGQFMKQFGLPCSHQICYDPTTA